MLLRFGVENHKSIRSYQEVSLVASALKDLDEGLLNPNGQPDSVPAKKRLSALPVMALYGANASGKTTVLDALQLLVGGIVSSHEMGANRKVPHRPFMLDEDSRNRPSRYDVDIVLEGVRYHYGYMATQERIVSEWLYSFPVDGSRNVRTTLFTRDCDAKEEFYFGKSLKGENRVISKLVRPNSLFLSAAAQNAHPQLSPIVKFFSEKVTMRMDDATTHFLPEQLLSYFGENETLRDQALNFLSSADTGIVGIDFSKAPIDEKRLALMDDFERLLTNHLEVSDLKVPRRTEEAQVRIKHAGETDKSYSMEIENESAGTIALLGLLGPLLKRLKEGGVLLIDELNSTLHPLISRELIRLFSRAETNPGKAQLLFSTHDTNLLSKKILRRDQVWFTEKDEQGATHIFSLAEMKVRPGENFESGYLHGRFGAIPFLGVTDSFIQDERGSEDPVEEYAK